MGETLCSGHISLHLASTLASQRTKRERERAQGDRGDTKFTPVDDCARWACPPPLPLLVRMLAKRVDQKNAQAHGAWHTTLAAALSAALRARGGAAHRVSLAYPAGTKDAPV